MSPSGAASVLSAPQTGALQMGAGGMGMQQQGQQQAAPQEQAGYHNPYAGEAAFS